MTSAPTLGAVHEVNERLRANPTPIEKPVQTRSLTASTPDRTDPDTGNIDYSPYLHARTRRPYRRPHQRTGRGMARGPSRCRTRTSCIRCPIPLRGTRPRFVTSGLYPASTWWNVRPALEWTGNSSARLLSSSDEDLIILALRAQTPRRVHQGRRRACASPRADGRHRDRCSGTC